MFSQDCSGRCVENRLWVSRVAAGGNQFKARSINQARDGGSCQRVEEKEVVRSGGIQDMCLRKSLQKLMMDVRRSVRTREEF